MTSEFGNVDAQQAVLGSLLIDPSMFDVVYDGGLRAEHFTENRNATIFAAIAELAHRGAVADLLTLADELERSGKTKAAGDLPYVMDLMNATPTAIHAEHYANIVKQDHERLRSNRAMNAIIRAIKADPGVNLADLLEQHAAALRKESLASNGTGVRTLADALTNLVDHADAAYTARKSGTMTDITTPFEQLNNAIAGLIPGDLVLIVGEPGVGKSTLVSQLAQHVAQQGHGVQMFITEVNELQFTARLVEGASKVWSRRMLTGDLSEQEWEAIMRTAGELESHAGAVVLDDATYDAQVIESKIRFARARLADAGVDLRVVVFDYLQLFKDTKRTDRRSEIGEIINTIRELTNRLGIVSIVVSSLSREGYKQNARPHIRNSKESGDIEYAVTIGLSVYRDADDASAIMCDVNKNRFGPQMPGIFLGKQDPNTSYIDPVAKYERMPLEE